MLAHRHRLVLARRAYVPVFAHGFAHLVLGESAVLVLVHLRKLFGKLLRAGGLELGQAQLAIAIGIAGSEGGGAGFGVTALALARACLLGDGDGGGQQADGQGNHLLHLESFAAVGLDEVNAPPGDWLTGGPAPGRHPSAATRAGGRESGDRETRDATALPPRSRRPAA